MPKLTIARHSSGRMIDIDRADNGLECDCTCSCCGARLIARQGELRAKSFAHEGDADCAGAIESALHKAAKQILKEEKRLYVGSYDPLTKLGHDFHQLLKNAIRSYRRDLLGIKSIEDAYWHFADRELTDALQSARNVCRKSHLAFSKVIIEENAEGTARRPDATAVTNQGNHVYIEFVVTHKCDKQKVSDLRELGVPTIQIDLSPMVKSEFTLEDVRNAVVYGKGVTKCEWLVMPKYIQDADTLTKQYVMAARARISELHAEYVARHRVIVDWDKSGSAGDDNSDKSTINSIDFLRAVITVSQREAEAIIWCDGPGLAGSAIKEVMATLEAGYTQAGNWVIAGENVFETVQAAFKNKEFDIRRKSATENTRIQYQESKSTIHNKAPESRQDAIKIVDVEAATKAIIAKHSGIVDYRKRRQKINEELLSLRFPLI